MLNWGVGRLVLHGNWAVRRPRAAQNFNPITYIASQCFICRRHASWCFAPLHSTCAASSKFGHEFRLMSPSKLESKDKFGNARLTGV